MLGCDAEQIVFTSGATESANTVLASMDNALISGIEHPCVRESARNREREVRVDSQGVADLDDLRSKIATSKPEVVCLMAANNETGVLQPWREALALCRESGVPFFCDAAQWVGKLPSRGLGECDFVSGCAHKFGGPVVVGFLKCPVHFKPLVRGGPQENGRRAGTENVASVLAMLAVLTARETDATDAASTFLPMRDTFERDLLAALPDARILGSGAQRLWNTVSVLMPETPDCRRRWVVVMDRLGFAVSTGSACASGKEKPSHVLTAMGIAPTYAGRALRFSSGWETTGDDWRKLLEGAKVAASEMNRGQ